MNKNLQKILCLTNKQLKEFLLTLNYNELLELELSITNNNLFNNTAKKIINKVKEIKAEAKIANEN